MLMFPLQLVSSSSRKPIVNSTSITSLHIKICMYVSQILTQLYVAICNMHALVHDSLAIPVISSYCYDIVYFD